MEQPKNDVLRVKRLHVEFQTSHGMVHAVKDVSLEVKRGRIHALVGESGSGKSVTSLTIMNLLAGNGKIIPILSPYNCRFLQLNNCFWKD